MRNGDEEDDAELLSGCEKSDIAVGGLMVRCLVITRRVFQKQSNPDIFNKPGARVSCCVIQEIKQYRELDVMGFFRQRIDLTDSPLTGSSAGCLNICSEQSSATGVTRRMTLLRRHHCQSVFITSMLESSLASLQTELSPYSF